MENNIYLGSIATDLQNMYNNNTTLLNVSIPLSLALILWLLLRK